MVALRSRIVRAAVLGAALLALLPALPVRAATFTFNAAINTPSVSGTGPPNNSTTLTLFSADGTLIDRDIVTSSPAGTWSVQFEAPIVVGSKIRASANSQTRLVTVPQLSIKANRVTDVLSGKAPANRPLTLTVGHNETLDPFDSTSHGTHTTSDGSGSWSRDTTPLVNFDGADAATAELSTSAGDVFSVTTDVPWMSVRRASSSVEAQLNNATSATIKLRRANGVLRATANLSWSASVFLSEGSFANASGDLVDVSAGNKVVGSFATDATFTVPAIAVAGDASTDQVTGHCMNNVPYRLVVIKPGIGSNIAHGTTNGSGNVSATISGLELSSKLTLTCRFATGDVIEAIGVPLP